MARDSIRGWKRWTRISLTVLVSFSAAAHAAAPADKPLPNVLLIVTDDQGFADFGFQGSKHIRTPHIDALARAGVRFTNAYVSHPYCSPTRAGLLTGRYQQRFGHENNPAYLPGDDTVGLPVGEVTLADVLKGAGYATAAIGKWHLGAAPPFHPMRRGFDEFFGFLGGGHDYFEAGPGKDDEYTAPIEHDGRPVELDGYLTDVLSEQAVGFIRRHRDQPFFLYLAYNAPHTPYQAPSRYCVRHKEVEDEDCRKYAAMISAVDDGVGRIADTLGELGIEDRTLIVFLSDNGGQTRYECADNSPLRGRKGQLYEGGVRVPFFMTWPQHLDAGESFEPLVSSLDVFATAASLAGVEPDPERVVDGVDLVPFLTGEKKAIPHGTLPHDTLYWRLGGGSAWALRQGRWKLIRQGGTLELYDLDTDLGEAHDLAAEEPEVVRRLTELYRAWDTQMVPPRWRNPG